MESSSNNCPQCREPFSIRLPESQRYTRCGLPLTLQCGHGVCYHCVVSRRRLNKFSPNATTKTDLNTFVCAVCSSISNVPYETLRSNVLAAINCYQLGLIHLDKLGVEVAGENIGFRDGGLFVPQSPHKIVERPPFVHPGTCEVHNMPKDFWCYDDETAVCGGCRISSHLNHDVVRITEKNEEELREFYMAVDETVDLVDEMKKATKAIQDKTKSVQSEYDLLISQMRHYFGDLHAVLAAREQQIQQQLYQSFQECTSPLKAVQRHLNDASKDIYAQLEVATTTANGANASRQTIARLTQSLRNLHYYEEAVKETGIQLESVAMHTTVETIPEYKESLRLQKVALVQLEDDRDRIYWNQHQELYVTMGQDMNRLIVESMNSTSPCDPQKKRARKQLYTDLPMPLLASQASNRYCEMDISAQVVHMDTERFYIQIEGDAKAELDRLQTKIQLHGQKSVPRLQDLNVGQLVAARYSANAQWYRAVIEEVNGNCDDAAIYFLDYGNRELTTAKHIRLLDDELSTDQLPAQAVCCALTNKNPFDLVEMLSKSQSKILPMHVDRLEPGVVGRLGGQELTLWVTINRPVEKPQPSTSIPKWMPSLDESATLPWLSRPSVGYKERTTITPPPPSATNGRKKRFPATKSVSSSSSTLLPSVAETSRPAPMATLASYQKQENLHRIKVLPLHLDSPGDFYVRLETAQKNFLLSTQHLAAYLSSSSLKQSELTAGMICAVKMDGQWLRCRIMRVVNQETASVWLMDVGKTLSVTIDSLRQLDEKRWMGPAATALRCRLWGVLPAGHLTNWSRSSADRLAELTKSATDIYVQSYFIQEEEMEDGSFQPVHYVRYYYEYVQPGGPLEFDEILTGCLNDELLNAGLALRKPMEVTVQPTPKRWLPSLILPPEMDCYPSWIDDEGFVYIQRPSGPMNHLDVISKLLHWHYAKSTASPSELSHWEKDEPCVARYSTDKMWCRAVVLSANDETKTACVLFIDYGNHDDKVAYEDMRKSLICFEYAAQASKCRMAKYPGPDKPAEKFELEVLDKLLVNQKCTVRLLSSTEEPPVIGLKLLAQDANYMDDVFNRLRPPPPPSTPSKMMMTSPSPPVSMPATPVPTLTMFSSVDLDDSIFDVNSSEFSDDVYPIFHFDEAGETAVEAELYQQLDVPSGCFLPIRIVSLSDEDLCAVIQPSRHVLNDSPSDWHQQVDEFARLETELQRSAPLFPDIELIDHGSPCACCNPSDERWYRGIVQGFVDDPLRIVRVELVDIGAIVKLSVCRVKQLPIEYLRLPRHSTRSRLIDYPLHPIQSGPHDVDLVRWCMENDTPLLAFFKENGRQQTLHQMTLFYKDAKGKFIPALELDY